MNGEAERSVPPRKPAYLDLMAALVFLAIGGVALAAMGTRVEDWVFPRVLAYLLVAIAAILALRGAAQAARGAGLGNPAVSAESRRRTLDVAVFTAAALAYALLIDRAGFWLSAFLMLVGASLYLSTRRSLRSVLGAMAAAVIVCGLAYLVFLRLFYVPLPSGSWW
jgi:hypothetical protein